jgi:Glycosyltransferase Family 4/Glycosyl transferases group 1
MASLSTVARSTTIAILCAKPGTCFVRSSTIFFTTCALAGEFDIIHAHDWLTADVLSLIKRQCSARRVLTMHSTEYGRCGNNLYPGQSEAVRHCEWQGIFDAERVICVSRALQDELAWLYSAPADKCRVIYNGIQPESFDYPCDPGEVRRSIGVHPMASLILFAGRIVFQKGVDILIDAVPYVLNHLPTAMFVFAGDGEMRWQLEGATKTRGLEHNTVGWARSRANACAASSSPATLCACRVAMSLSELLSLKHGRRASPWLPRWWADRVSSSRTTARDFRSTRPPIPWHGVSDISSPTSSMPARWAKTVVVKSKGVSPGT